MNRAKQEKLARFMADEVMHDAVYDVILHACLKPVARDDVHVLAASRIAIDLLNEAWRELEIYKTIRDDDARTTGNVGL